MSLSKLSFKQKSLPNMPTDWWTPVWRGLVIDETAKHYRTMRKAVWLYLYLLLFANRKTGIVQRKLETIVSHIGISRRTLQRYFSTLRNAGYITVKNSGHSLTITINKWKPLRRSTHPLDQKNQEQNSVPPKRHISPRNNFRNNFQRTLFSNDKI